MAKRRSHLSATPLEAGDQFEYFIGEHVRKLCSVIEVHGDPDDYKGYAVTLRLPTGDTGRYIVSELVANDLKPHVFTLRGLDVDRECLRACKGLKDYPKEVCQRLIVDFTFLGERHYTLNFAEYGVPFNPNNMTFAEYLALNRQWSIKMMDSSDEPHEPLTGLARFKSIRLGLRKPGTQLNWRHSVRAAYIWATRDYE
jgi:hypothetical protein